MSFFNFKGLMGAAVLLVACSAAPSMAQENVPPREGVPQLNREGADQESTTDGSMTEEVRGKVTRISGDQVDVRTSSGIRTYEISEADQERNNIDVGSDVVLTVRGDSVVAISPASMNSSSSSSSSSSSTTRQETTVQQTRPAPRPAPAPAPAARPAPEPQPVRGLW